MTTESDLEQSAAILAFHRDGCLSEAIDFTLSTLRAMHAPLVLSGVYRLADQEGR